MEITPQPKLTFLAKTKAGRDAQGFLVDALIVFALAQGAIMAGQRGGDSFFDNLYISIPMVIAGLAIAAGAAFGWFAILKRRERAVTVYLVTLLGTLVVLFLAGEFLGPKH